MLKLCGAVLVLMSGLCLGVYASSRLRLRAESLRQLLTAVAAIRTQTRYGDDLLGNVLLKAAGNAGQKTCSFLRAIAQALQSDRFLSPKEATRLALEKFAPCLALTKADAHAVLFLMEKLGCMQRKPQENYLELVELELTRLLRQAEEDAEKKGRLFSYGGACGGLLLVILMV